MRIIPQLTKIISKFVVQSSDYRHNISESVSLILGRKIWRFGKHKDSKDAHHRVWLSSRYTNRCEVLFIYAWATPNAFYQINELPHTFFLY